MGFSESGILFSCFMVKKCDQAYDIQNLISIPSGLYFTNVERVEFLSTFLRICSFLCVFPNLYMFLGVKSPVFVLLQLKILFTRENTMEIKEK